MSVRAAGRSSTSIRIIPISTILQLSSWRWIGPPSNAIRRDRAGTRVGRGHAVQQRRLGAFDADNTFYYLNNIPFADHGALLDPPTPDLAARCLSMLAQLGERPESSAVMRRAIEFLRREQRPEGCWFGRWGVNYIYGTWSALCALTAAGIDPMSSMVRRAVDWLTVYPESRWRLGRRRDKLPARLPGPRGCAEHGIADRMGAARPDGCRRSSFPPWRGAFPICGEPRARTVSGRRSAILRPVFRVCFYLRYHGYSKFFPLWALARYRNLTASNSRAVRFGM